MMRYHMLKWNLFLLAVVLTGLAFPFLILGQQSPQTTPESIALEYLSKYEYAVDRSVTGKERAIKEAQGFLFMPGVEPTGKLDAYTVAAMQALRCGCPDHARASEYGEARATWPKGCYDNLLIHVDFAGSPYPESQLRPAFQDVLDGFMDVCGLGLSFTNDRSQANIVINWQAISGQTIGLGYYPNGTCQLGLRQHLDRSYRATIGFIQQLFAHELGHNLGFEHTNGGLMHPSIREPWSGIRKTDPTYSRLVKAYEQPSEPPVVLLPVRKPIGPKLPFEGKWLQLFELSTETSTGGWWN